MGSREERLMQSPYSGWLSTLHRREPHDPPVVLTGGSLGNVQWVNLSAMKGIGGFVVASLPRRWRTSGRSARGVVRCFQMRYKITG